MASQFAMKNTLLKMLGKYTMVIYLMNTLCMGATTAILLKFVSLTGPNFTVFLPVLVCIGLFVPIGIKKLFFDRTTFFRQLTN